MPTPTESPGLVARIIDLAGRRRLIIFLLAGALTVLGVLSAQRAQLDALPDLSDTQVIVATEWMGRSPTLIESQVTYPLVTTFLGAPKIKTVRGFTMFGMSFVYVVFEDGTDLYWARSRVVEALAKAQGKLPEGVTPQIGPDATSVGWVYQYALVDESGSTTCSSCARFKTGTCATGCRGCPAWPRWPASAASRRSTRFKSTRPG
jgi:copper/silver efflux system protein